MKEKFWSLMDKPEVFAVAGAVIGILWGFSLGLVFSVVIGYVH